MVGTIRRPGAGYLNGDIVFITAERSRVYSVMHTEFQQSKAAIYKSHRQRAPIVLKKKHIRQFDEEFERLTAAELSMSVLEIGCGAGIFLRYLRYKGFENVTAIDYDENLKDVLADLSCYELHFGDASEIVESLTNKKTFDRIVLFDVIEHMPIDGILAMMRRLDSVLAPGGKILIRVPNVSSPWGLNVFFGSFDHVTPFSPGRIHELSHITGFRCTTIVGQTTGKLRRKILQRVLHAVLSKALTSPPDIWEENLLCVLERKA